MWRAIKRGASSAARYPAPLVALFLAYLAGALLLTLPVYAALNGALADKLAAADMARTFDVWLFIESALSTLPARSTNLEIMPAAPTQSDVLSGTLASVAGLLALGLVQLSSLPNALVSGGALRVYADERFTWRRFAWGCWHWALPFTVLLVVFGLAAGLIVIGGLAAGVLVGALGLDVLLAPVLVLALALYVATAALFDYARAIAVCEGRRNVFWALARAAGFVARRPLPTIGAYAALSLLGLALIASYTCLAAPLVPFEWVLAGIGLQQAFVLARLWARLARWATALALYRAS